MLRGVPVVERLEPVSAVWERWGWHADSWVQWEIVTRGRMMGVDGVEEYELRFGLVVVDEGRRAQRGGG